MSYYRVIYHDAMSSGDHLEHHGILGMKWGVRRYQNPDGSLTEEGKERYAKQYIGKAKPDEYIFGPFRPKHRFDFKGKKRYEIGNKITKLSADDLLSLRKKLLSDGYSRKQLEWIESEINHKDRLKYLEMIEEQHKKDGIPVFEPKTYTGKELANLVEKQTDSKTELDTDKLKTDRSYIRSLFFRSPLSLKGYGIATELDGKGCVVYDKKEAVKSISALKKDIINEQIRLYEKSYDSGVKWSMSKEKLLNTVRRELEKNFNPEFSDHSIGDDISVTLSSIGPAIYGDETVDLTGLYNTKTKKMSQVITR